jgi:hypothetical protein
MLLLNIFLYTYKHKTVQGSNILWIQFGRLRIVSSSYFKIFVSSLSVRIIFFIFCFYLKSVL